MRKYQQILTICCLLLMFCYPNIPIQFEKDQYNQQNQMSEEGQNQIQELYKQTTEINEVGNDLQDIICDEATCIDLIPPKPNDFYNSYQYTEYPLDDSFDDNTIAPWTEDFTLGSESSGAGWIYCQNGWVYLKGVTQKMSIPGVGQIPELPDDMSINSGNLVNPDHPWGTGELTVRFTPHHIVETWEQIGTVDIYGIPMPIYAPVYRIFYINYRTSPEDSFTSNTIYSYTDESEETQTVTIPLDGITFTNYFEISIRLFAQDANDWVAFDYAKIRCYQINITESLDPIPSNVDIQLTVDFLQTHFSLNTNGATISAYVNPDGGVVNSSSQFFTASGDNSNPYIITIPASVYIQGDVTYKIRFQSTTGHVFWTPTYEFYCYDNDPPTTTVTNFNATISYHQNLVITANINDTGGGGLGTAKVVWDYNKDPVESSSLSTVIETSPNGVDNFVATFIIATDFLKWGYTLRFQVWVYDRAGNKGSSSIYNVNPTDYIAPAIDLWEKSFWWDSSLSRYVVDLGYPLITKWTLNEPTQASGITNNIINRYIAIKNSEFAPTGPSDYTVRYDFNETLGNDYIFEWEHNYPATTWFQLIVYSKDNANNEAWTYYSLYVADRRAPDIIEGINNTISPNYNQNLILFFSAFEPTVAAGVNEGTITFEYSINNQGLGSTKLPTIQNGGIYFNRTYVIPEEEYNWGDILYYRYSVADLFGNQFNTGIRSLSITDQYLPTLSIVYDDFEASNFTIVYSYFDISLKCIASDQLSEGGSGLDYARLYYQNASSFVDFNNVGMWAYLDPIYNLTNTQFFFLIPQELVSIDGIAIAVRAYDKEGNYKQWTILKNVIDASRPIVKKYDLGTSHEYYLNRETTVFYFELSIESYIIYAVDGVKMGAPITASHFTVPITFIGEGNHNVSVYFNDFVWHRTLIVDMTPPPAVSIIKAGLYGKQHHISWIRPEELGEYEEVLYYLYRGTTEDFAIADAELVATTQDLNYEYEFDETGAFYYRIVVYDLAMNPSTLSPTSDRILMVKSETSAITITALAIIAAVLSLSALAIIRYRRFYGIVRDPSKSKLVAFSNKIKAKIYARKFRQEHDFARKEKIEENNILVTRSEKQKPILKANSITTSLPKELKQVQSRLSPEAQKLLAQNEVKEIDDAIDKVTAVKKKGDDGWMEEVNGSDDGWK